MTPAAVHALLESEADPRGIAHWEKRYADSPLRSVGIGLTKLRKMAKKLGRNRTLALALWESDLYEARVLALLLDDPKQITREQAEQQVEQLDGGQLAHVFASCDATLAKTKWAAELAEDWMMSDDARRRECGYSLLYEVSKSKKKSAPDEAWFADWIERIEHTQADEPVDVRMSMASALMGIGKRSATLHGPALAAARAIGPIDWDPTGACDPFDVVKHLDNERLRKKFGLG